MDNTKKNLTKRPYALVLYAAGIGSNYYTVHEIINNMKGNGSKDVYRMIKELAPSDYVEDEPLLNLDDLLSTGTNSGRYKRKLIRNINRIFHLKWEIDSNDNDKMEIEEDNRRVQFKIEKIEEDCRSITVYHDSGNAISIGLDPKIKDYGYGFLIIANGRKIVRELKLIVKRNRKTGKRALYTTKWLEKRPRYLDFDLNDRAKKALLEINPQALSKNPEYDEDLRRDLPRILEINNNRDNWVYHPNFRGLLLFLASESRLEDEAKSKKEIHNLLLRGSDEWITKEAPFLGCWQNFENIGFDVMGTLRNIGAESINQVIDENIDDYYLLTRVTERYYDSVSFYIEWLRNPLFLAKNKKYFEEYINQNIRDKFHSYRLGTLTRLRMGFIKKVETIDKILEHYDSFSQ